MNITVDVLEESEYYLKMSFKSVVTSLFGARDWFHGRQFSTDGAGSGDGFRMIQAHCIYCALYF